MRENRTSTANKRGFMILIAIIAALTILSAADAGRTAPEILAYLGFTIGISYIFFG